MDLRSLMSGCLGSRSYLRFSSSFSFHSLFSSSLSFQFSVFSFDLSPLQVLFRLAIDLVVEAGGSGGEVGDDVAS